MERARTRSLACYTERHHVVPRCLKGSNAASNIVRLTAEEHYLAHQLLAKIHPDHLGLLSAAVLMAGGANRAGNKQYGWIKRQLGRQMGNRLRGRRQQPDHVAKAAATRVGVPLSEEHRRKISEARRGIITYSDETRAKIAARLTGRKIPPEVIAKRSATKAERRVPVSAETRQKLSAARKANPITPEERAKLNAGIVMYWAKRRALESDKWR